MPNVTIDRALLEAALSGLEAQRATIDEHIRNLQRLINGTSRADNAGGRGASSDTRQNHRRASGQRNSADAGTKASRERPQADKRGGAWTPERRRRMAEAMKRRWADGSIKRALKRAKR
jgi:hypothetical protein